jgi:uncharacterized BrkB/YihY/UPF0761 family membrane protein
VSIGTGILLIVVGLILQKVITADVEGINIQALGGILVTVGILVLIVALIFTAFTTFRRRGHRRPRRF